MSAAAQNSAEISPVYIAWEIQKACNLGCRFCYSSSWNLARAGTAQNGNPELDFIKEKLALLKQAFPKLTHINWSGGEPLLRNGELGQIFRDARELGLKNILSTNGNFSAFGKNWDQFRAMLDEWSEDLDVLSISYDSPHDIINNEVMRVEYAPDHPFASTTASTQSEDIKQVLKAFRDRLFPFSLKVNTMVTAKNKEKLDDMVEVLRDVPCIWHLIEFNPRQCPEESIKEFSLQPSEFDSFVATVHRRIEGSQQPCKFYVTTRVYDGDNKAYPFLVINTSGKVLLPFGHEHHEVCDLKQASDAHQILSSVQVGIEAKVPDNTTAFFNEGNRRILDRYLHRTAAVVHQTFNLQWLREMVSESLQFPLASVQRVDQFLDREFGGSNWPDSLKTACAKVPGKGAGEELEGQTVGALMLEQVRVGRFLADAYGILGGTLVLLPTDRTGRHAPAIASSPPGLHFPWCFPTRALKRKYFRSVFKGGVQEGEQVSAATILHYRKLPEGILDKVLEKSLIEADRSSLKEAVKSYIAYEEPAVEVSDEIWIWILLSRCIESILEVIVKEYHRDMTDPWVAAFLTNKEPTLFVQPEQAKARVSQFIASKLSISDQNITARWAPPPAAPAQPEAASADGHNVLPAIWYFLFDSLPDLGLCLPDVFAFKAGGGPRWVAVGSIYLFQEAGVESLCGAKAVKRRVGSFLEALATPTLAAQLAIEREEQIRKEAVLEENERLALVQRRIESDLKKLLTTTNQVSVLSFRIRNAMDTSNERFLKLHQVEGISYLFSAESISFWYSGSGDFDVKLEAQTGYIQVSTIHSTTNPGNGDLQAVWMEYGAFLKRVAGPDILNESWLTSLVGAIDEQIAAASDDNVKNTFAKRPLDFLKLILHKPHRELRLLHEAQIVFAVGMAATWIDKFVYCNGSCHEVASQGGIPEWDAWLKLASVDSATGNPFFSENPDHALPIPGDRGAADVLGALMRLCGELTGRSGAVKLTTWRLESSKEGSMLILECANVLPERVLLLDEQASGHGLRSCLDTLCAAVNQRQPEVEKRDYIKGSFHKGLVVWLGTGTVFTFGLSWAPKAPSTQPMAE